MIGKTYATLIGALVAISLLLSFMIVTASAQRGPRIQQVFEAEKAPQAVEALLAAAGLPSDERPAAVLAPGAAKAIAGTSEGTFTLKGLAFKKPIKLRDAKGAKQWKAKAAPLVPDERSGTAKGSLFPDAKLSGVKKNGLPKVKKDALGRTKFKSFNPEPKDQRQIVSPSLKTSKPGKAPFNKSFALVGKISKKDGKAVGMITAPALEYRQWAERIKAKKKEGRTAVVNKRLPGSFTKLDEKTPPEQLYLADTKLGRFNLKVSLRGGVPVDFRIRKSPSLKSSTAETGG